MGSTGKEWFESWFDSPYYDLLYAKRNETEAAYFIDNLLAKFNLPLSTRILDLACGKGRHSIYLHSKGYQVTGIDLSQRSIAYAAEHAAPGLRFLVRDMRSPLDGEHFGLILNLFTSFGYFDDPSDNIKVLEGVVAMLENKGLFVLDYLNSALLAGQDSIHETRTISGIHFEIEKKVENGFVVKNIIFKANGIEHRFQERVKLFSHEELKEMFCKVGMEVVYTFGNYALEPYQETISDRLIFVVNKR